MTGSGDTNPTPDTAREYLERVVDANRERIEESVRLGEAELSAMRSDVVARAKAALDRAVEVFDQEDSLISLRAAGVIEHLTRFLVPELVAEVETLRERLGLLQGAGVEEFAALQVLKQRDRDAVAAELKRLGEQ